MLHPERRTLRPRQMYAWLIQWSRDQHKVASEHTLLRYLGIQVNCIIMCLFQVCILLILDPKLAWGVFYFENWLAAPDPCPGQSALCGWMHCRLLPSKILSVHVLHGVGLRATLGDFRSMESRRCDNFGVSLQKTVIPDTLCRGGGFWSVPMNIIIQPKQKQRVSNNSLPGLTYPQVDAAALVRVRAAEGEQVTVTL